MSENKSLSLYNIADEMNAFIEMMNLDGGEVTAEHEEIEKQLSTLLLTKVDSCASWLSKLDGEIELAKAEEKRIESFRETREAAIKRFKDYVKMCMQKMGKEKLTGQLCEITLRKPTKVLKIFNENAIPEKYQVVSVSIDAAKLKEDLKSGEIAGCADYDLIDGVVGVQFKDKSVK